MGKAAVAKAFEDIKSALAVLHAEVDGSGLGAVNESDPLAALADGCLDILAGAAGVEAGIAGLKARAAVTYSDTVHAVAPPDAPVQAQEMAAAAEIGSLLALSGRAAGAFLAASHALVTTLPLTLAALQAGTVSWRHAQVMVEETATLDPSGATALETHFLGPDAPQPAMAAPIGEIPAYRFKAKARAWRERHHAQSIEKRHAKSMADRRVEYAPDQDGMAWLSLYLPADTACAIWNRSTALARGLQGTHEPRTLTQLRLDTTVGLLLTAPVAGSTRHGHTTVGATAEKDTAYSDTADSDTGNRESANRDTASRDNAPLGKVPAPKADVLVTVPVFALLGLTDEPAMLDGFGPIPASMARKLLAEGANSFHRVLIDPRDGAPLEIGRTNYRLTTAMKRALQLRDGKCTFPGCNNQSLDNDADHLTAWHHGGTTGISNLAQLCPKHHHLKHNSDWTPTPATKNHPPGWTSPTGRHYKPEHHHWEPPHWPHQLQTVPGNPPRGDVDFVRTEYSLGEEGIERFLRARDG